MNWKPPLVDAAIAAVFVAMTTAEALFSAKVSSPVEHVVIAGLAMASLAWRRRAPLAVAAIVVGSNLIVNPQGEFTTLLSLVLVCFTLGAETEPPWSYIGIGTVFTAFLVTSIIQTFEPSDLAAGLVFFVGPWAVGVVTRGRLASADEAVARADQLERNRELEAAKAAAEERTRIARELHDIISHSISVVTIQTQAVRRRLGPDHAAEAADLAAVERTAREALAEMRRLFGVLRTEGEQPLALAPQPGSRSWTGWCARWAPRTCRSTCASRAIPSRSARAWTWRRTASPRRASPTRCATPRPPAPTCWCATRPAGWTSRWRTTGEV